MNGSTAAWITFFTVVVGFIYQAYREGRQRKWDREDRAEVAAKVGEVKATLENATANTDQKLNGITKLVDGAMEVQLEINRTLARRVADATKDPADESIAKLAEKKYSEHAARMKAAKENPVAVTIVADANSPVPVVDVTQQESKP